MSKEKDFVVEVPEDFKLRWPHLYTPSIARHGVAPKYSHTFPALADDRFTRKERDGVELMTATSNHRPLIVPGDDSWDDKRHFEALINRAAEYRLRPEEIIGHRPCKLLLRPLFLPRSRFYGDRWRLELLAVQVGGNLREDKPLDAYIREVLQARRAAIDALLEEDDGNED